METLNSIVQVLQLNETFFLYFAVFFVFIMFIAQALLKPYYEKFLARENQTKGQTLLASELQKKEEELNKEYEQRLAAFHQKFQTELDERKNQILKTHQIHIDQTRKRVRNEIDNTINSFRKELTAAEKELEKQAPELAEKLRLKLVQ